MAEEWEQEELFPSASQQEIQHAKSLLMRYRRCKAIVTEMQNMELNEQKRSKFQRFERLTQDIERAVRLILDPEVRRIIELRYIKGERHKVVVLHFGVMHPSTVDRKIKEGIESVANSLKLLGS